MDNRGQRDLGSITAKEVPGVPPEGIGSPKRQQTLEVEPRTRQVSDNRPRRDSQVLVATCSPATLYILELKFPLMKRMHTGIHNGRIEPCALAL